MPNSIIFDWKGTLYDSNQRRLIDGAVQVLDFLLSCDIKLYLIGKNAQDSSQNSSLDMYDEVKRLEVNQYFQQVIFTPKSKSVELFQPFVNLDNPSSTIVIGDRIHSEIAVGKLLGTTTIWIQQGKFSSEIPTEESQEPDYIVSNLVELLILLKEILVEA